MGGTQTTQRQKILTDFTTSTKEEINTQCSAVCQTDVSDVYVSIAGPTKSLTISATCNTNASCLMTNQTVATVQSILSNALSQDSTTISGIFGGALLPVKTSETVNITSTITNNITQITESTCQASSTADVNNVVVYVAPTGSAGKLYIGSNSNANSTCTMNNLAKIQLQNQVNNKSAIKAKTKSLLSVIFTTLMVVVLIGGIIILLLISSGFLKGTFGGGGDGNAGPAEGAQAGGKGGAAPAQGGQAQPGLLQQLNQLASSNGTTSSNAVTQAESELAGTASKSGGLLTEAEAVGSEALPALETAALVV